nr:MAG TPA: Protein of unknown function (DUF3789) [Caudoviricetes sp.]
MEKSKMFSFNILGLIVYSFLMMSVGAGVGIVAMALLVGSKL